MESFSDMFGKEDINPPKKVPFEKSPSNLKKSRMSPDLTEM